MGEMAEYCLAQELEEMATKDLLSFIHRDRKNRVIWVTKDGRRLQVKNMTTSHIENSLAKCKRDEWREEAIPYFEEELERRK